MNLSIRKLQIAMPDARGQILPFLGAPENCETFRRDVDARSGTICHALPEAAHQAPGTQQFSYTFGPLPFTLALSALQTTPSDVEEAYIMYSPQQSLQAPTWFSKHGHGALAREPICMQVVADGWPASCLNVHNIACSQASPTQPELAPHSLWFSPDSKH